MTSRQIHLVAYSKTGPTARHRGGWRHSEARLDDVLKPERCARHVRTLEDAKFVAPTYFPGMIEQFCRSVVPILQRRGLFRTEYTGRALRENLLGAAA